MKIFKTILALTMLITLCAVEASAQDTTIIIKTSSQCEDCKKRIENAVSFEKGVKNVNLDVSTKNATITYDKTKTSPDKLKKIIAKVGYDADEIPAEAKAYKKLPKCCRKGGHK